YRMGDTPEKLGKMVHASFKGTGSSKIMLIAHMDTVYPSGMLAKQPFRIDGDKAYGLGIADDKLYPIEAGLRLEQTLFDGGVKRQEVKRQAARTDGAAFRVEERSQFIALQVTRQYLDYLLQQRIVAASEDNIGFHSKLVTDLREGVAKGSLSIADQQQAEEQPDVDADRLDPGMQADRQEEHAEGGSAHPVMHPHHPGQALGRRLRAVTVPRVGHGGARAGGGNGQDRLSSRHPGSRDRSFPEMQGEKP
ncbi:MAG: TolC family protein, partial [Proteobacteria bacterium]|nr:TolC family protein [Pseudomonadota bacterium]